MRSLIHKPYIFSSRIATHVVFWIVYYVLFSLIWAEEGNYYRSFALEFVLMPVRILASYFTMYYLIPRILLKEQLVRFAVTYIILMVFSGVLQRIFMYFFL